MAPVRAPGHLLTHWRPPGARLAACGAGLALTLRPWVGPVTCRECLARSGER